MDNYTLEIFDKEKRKEASNNFILKYDIKTNIGKASTKKIVVYLANGQKVVFPYSKETEQKILEQMKKNITNYFDIINGAKNHKMERDVLAWSLNATSAVVLASGVVVSALTCDPASLACIITAPVMLASSLIYKSRYTARLNDYDKNVLFLENEERINKHVESGSNVISNVISKKTREKIVTKPDGQKGFTINSIDKMTYKDLNHLLLLIRLEESLSTNDRNAINESNNQRTLKK